MTTISRRSSGGALLARDDFREAVFARDGHRCVVCGASALDAHHLMERRLFADGGYYLDNGVSVCETHHREAESTGIAVQTLRDLAGITSIRLPEHLYCDAVYDKWGNIVMENGTRLPGELFGDASVQKALKAGPHLASFTHLVKYPRTHHLPWSESVGDDDRVIGSLDPFVDQRVIVTEKMDGENTTMYRDAMHARSVDGRGDPARSVVQNLWGARAHEIPHGFRVCGENLYARHQIRYGSLPSYFLGFSVWNEANVCLGWEETLTWFELLDLAAVPVLYDGIFDESAIRALWRPEHRERTEGYVVRLAGAFAYGAFRSSVAKFVRAGHLDGALHGAAWRRRIDPNGLASESTA